VMAILISVGALGLATFGRNTKSIVIGNIKGKAPAVAVQILYLLVAILSFPMITWTPIKITERWFGWTDRQSGAKWRKNAWRIFMVLVCLAISVAGSTELDNFVAIIGGVCCVPLALIFPPLFHTLILRKHGQLGRCSRIGNATLITAGVGVGILSSCMAIIGWAS
jgi:proton-coupled amino acid transporter